MSRTSSQRGFAPILILILIAVAGIVGYVLIPKPGGVEYIKRQLTWPRPTPTPTPPPGCYYHQVECFTTPCDPILVCPTPTDKIDEAANWKVYRNTTIGFSLKYPSDYLDLVKPPGESVSGKETNDILIFENSGKSSLLSIFPFPGNLDELIKLHKANRYDKTFPYNVGDYSLIEAKNSFKVGGKDAVWYVTHNPVNKGEDGFEAWFTGNGYGFILDVQAQSELGNLQEIPVVRISPELIKSILSTFT